MQKNGSKGRLERGLTLLSALGDYPEGVRVSELAREAGLPVSTVHRLMGVLVAEGYASFDSDRHRYFLSLKIFELSHRVSLVHGLSELALPVMRRIVGTTGEPSLMSVLSKDEMVYLERIESWRRIQIRGSVGERGPLYCTSLGKSLLAFLPEENREEILGRISLEKLAPNTITNLSDLRTELELTRERGYAVADEEHEESIRAVGVPVMNSRPWPVASICVAAPAFRVSREQLEEFVPLLREGAREIGVQLPRNNVPAVI